MLNHKHLTLQHKNNNNNNGMIVVQSAQIQSSLKIQENIIENFCQDLLKYDFMMIILCWCRSKPFEEMYLTNNISELIKVFLYEPFILEMNNKSIYLFNNTLKQFQIYMNVLSKESMGSLDNFREYKHLLFQNMKLTMDNEYLIDFKFNYVLNRKIDRMKLIYMLFFILMDFKTIAVTKKMVKTRRSLLTLLKISLSNLVTFLTLNKEQNQFSKNKDEYLVKLHELLVRVEKVLSNNDEIEELENFLKLNIQIT